jgi:hypothetical protein
MLRQNQTRVLATDGHAARPIGSRPDPETPHHRPSSWSYKLLFVWGAKARGHKETDRSNPADLIALLAEVFADRFMR